MPHLAPKLAVLTALAVLSLPACSSGPHSAPSPSTPTAPSASTSPTTSPTATASTTPTESGAPSTAPVAGTQIVISKFLYSPVNLQVKPGATVTVVNQDPVAHTVTAETGSGFDSGTINGNATGTFTAPTTPGTYRYICIFHSQMHGILTVSP
jgi:plastocyanin